jgi:uncharacterized protein YukE
MVCTALAENENTDSRCKSLEFPGYKIFRVDARHMNQYHDSRFNARDRVQIILENMNPFLFEYKVTIKGERVPEPALEALGELFPGLKLKEVGPAKEVVAADLVEKAQAASSTKTQSLLPDAPAQNCHNAIKTVWEMFKVAIKTNHKNLKTELDNASKQYNSIKSESDNMNDILKEHLASLHFEMAECKELAEVALNLAIELKSRIDKIENHAKSFKDASVLFNEYLERQEDILAEFSADVTEDEEIKRICLGKEKIEAIVKSMIQTYEDGVKSYRDNMKTLNEEYKKVIDLIDNYKNQLSSLEETLDRSDNFTRSYTIGPYGEPTDVMVKIERKKLTEEEAKLESLMTAKLNFGGRARFALAAGVGFSFLDNKTYKRVWGFELDRDGKPVENGNPTIVIGKEEDSNSRSFALLMMHTRVLSRDPITFHISLGLTGITGTDKTLEYIWGVSLGLAEERFFLTLGAHYGRYQELGGSMYLGRPVPDEVSDIPIRNKWKWAFAITLSYRIM